jgi:hypothetical protein
MPPLRFTRNVLEEISKYQIAPATKTYINTYIIRAISAFFLIFISGFLIYLIGQIKWTSGNSNNLLPEYLTLTRFNWSGILNSTSVNIFIGVNVILGLVFIDKHLQNKKNYKPGNPLHKGDTA